MKHFRLLLLLFATTLIINNKATAQWDLFADLLGQLDDETFNNYLNNLDDLNQDWDIDQVDLNNILDDQYDLLNNPFPGGILDSSYLTGIDQGLLDLDILLDGAGLPNGGQDTILGELDRLQDIFEMNFDSLGNIFGQYSDSLGTDPNWDVTIIDYDDQVDLSFDLLNDSLGISLNDPTLSVDDLPAILDQLFSRSLFQDLEIAYGAQSSDLKYWEDRYSATANVIRVGSVPNFDRTAVDCHDGILRLPIEARWHMEASWINGRIPFSIDNSNNIGQGGLDSEARSSDHQYNYNNTADRKFNPLMLYGDFALMATPTLGRIGNTYFRLITSLGLEAGTYAPAHREYYPIRTANNRGFATGFGPQVGSGFSIINGPLIIYSMGTISRGEVLRCALPYEYESHRFEAGIRYGNVINVRCSTGHVSWQENDNRRANIRHQVTVGIILGSLNR